MTVMSEGAGDTAAPHNTNLFLGSWAPPGPLSRKSETSIALVGLPRADVSPPPEAERRKRRGCAPDSEGVFQTFPAAAHASKAGPEYVMSTNFSSSHTHQAWQWQRPKGRPGRRRPHRGTGPGPHG